jgi:hypothetical protein
MSGVCDVTAESSAAEAPMLPGKMSVHVESSSQGCIRVSGITGFVTRYGMRYKQYMHISNS